MSGNIQITISERIGEDARRGKRSFHHIRSELHEVIYRDWARGK
jgi:hypothetical protein